MKSLLYNLSLAALGCAAVEHYLQPGMNRPLVFIAVFSGMFLALWLLFFFFDRKYFFKFPKLVRYMLFIVKELFSSSFRVAYDVLTPVDHLNPAIIAIPLDAETDREIAALGTLITFTPGTLSLYVSDDKKTLYVHEMYIPENDVDAVRKKIKDGFEKKLLELMR